MTARIFAKLIVAVIAVMIVALTAVDVLTSQYARRSYIDTLKRELADKGRMLAFVEGEAMARLDHSQSSTLAHSAGGRLTIISSDGHVVVESDAQANLMENHRERPEFQRALLGEVGSDIRLSRTTGLEYLYVAVPFSRGAIRLAVPLSDIDRQISQIRRQLILSVVLAFLPAILVAAFFARHVSAKLAAIIEYAAKLANGDLRAHLRPLGRDELGTLGSRLCETGKHLQSMVAALEAEHEKLERLERVRKDFVINVSHELRTPLASIQGYSETLLEGAIHDPRHNVRFLQIIHQNAERLGRLTSDLLTLSRIEMKREKFQFAGYYVNTLIQDCVDAMAPIAAKKAVPIRFEPAPDGTEVFCDAEAIHQVLSNLLDNALKYTPVGGHVTVSALATTGALGREEIEIAVSDTGVGIPAEDLPRLFERFYRVDKARSRELGGTGLGLAIVKHLVLAHGGRVWVDSQPDSGSTFRFTLPVHDTDLPETGQVQEAVTNL